MESREIVPRITCWGGVLGRNQRGLGVVLQEAGVEQESGEQRGISVVMKNSMQSAQGMDDAVTGDVRERELRDDELVMNATADPDLRAKRQQSVVSVLARRSLERTVLAR